MSRLVTLALLVITLSVASAQKRAAPPPPTNPLPSHWGGAPGTTARLTLPPEKLKTVRGLWTPDGWPARITATSIELDVPKSEPIGPVPIRLIKSDFTLLPSRFFSVDALPEAQADPKATRRAEAQLLDTPCVVTGNIDPESACYFRVAVRAGVPLVVDALAKRHGSALDPTLTLTTPEGRFLPGAFADDTPGLLGDARVVYTAKNDGFAVVELRDSTYQGGPEHHFRLRLDSEVPLIGVTPAAIARGEMAKITLLRADGSAGASRMVSAPDQPDVAGIALAETGAWPVELHIADQPQQGETEPNDTPEQAEKLAGPCGVTGAFLTPGDRDCFSIEVAAGETWSVTARTAAIHSPCEVSIVVRSGTTELAKSDPAKPVAEATFTAKSAGRVSIICESLNGIAGPRERYWLDIRRVEPDFRLTLPDPRITLIAGGTNLLAVDVTRLGGLNDRIELTATGRLTGRLSIPKGVSGRIWFPVQASESQLEGPASFAVIGRSGVQVHSASISAAPASVSTTIAAVVRPGEVTTARVMPIFFGAKPGKPFLLTMMLEGHSTVKKSLTLTVESPFKLVKPSAVTEGRFSTELVLDKEAKPGITALGWRLVGRDGQIVSSGAEWVTVVKPMRAKP